MAAQRTTLPGNSALHSQVAADDFLDCYSVMASMPPRAAAEIVTVFPWWAQSLLRVRNVVTAPFGLSKDGPMAQDKIGSFPVEYESDTEIIAGFDDRHLNFRVSVISQEGNVYLATWVHPHNIGGRLYLASIMPFHILIVKNALNRVARSK